MKNVLVLLSLLLLSGCEPFPSEELVSEAKDVPTQSSTSKTESSETPSIKVSDSKPSESNNAPTISTQSTESENAPITNTESTKSSNDTLVEPLIQKLEESEEVEVPKEKPNNAERIVPHAGKLEIIGTYGEDNYYMKTVIQPDAICYVLSNSKTWDSSISCIPKPESAVK